MSQTSPDTGSKSALLAWIKDPARRPADLAAATGFFPEVDRAIAFRVDCPPEVLATLSHSSDKATRAKVTANPNTPAADYVRLGQQFPKEFIANPLLDLMLLENPALLDEVPTALLVQIAKKPECPAAFLIWAASHADEKVQLAVAMNAKAPAEALERLRQSPFAKVRESTSAAGAAVEGDPEVLFREAVRERLAALTPEEAKEAWEKKYIGLPQCRELSLWARLSVADVKDQLGMVRNLAENPNLPPDLLEQLAKIEDKDLRGSVASNPNAPVWVLAALAKEDSMLWREVVAMNPNTPASVLEALATDSSWVVRSRVAENPKSPQSVLEWLALDEEDWVRRRLAANPKTPIWQLETLARDDESQVREAVARNPNVPQETRDVLALDVDPLVRNAVAGNPTASSDLCEALLDPLAKCADESVRAAVACNPNTPLTLLNALAKDRSEGVRIAVARNPNTPVDLLKALAKDKEYTVRESVAANPAAPVVLLAKLAKDQDYGVLSSVAGNPSTPVDVLAKLAEEIHEVRWLAAANPSTPVDLLETLIRAEDWDWLSRRSAAQNPSMPGHILRLTAESFLALFQNAKRDPLTAPELVKRLTKAPAAQKSAAQEGNFLFFVGKDPNKTVLSKHTLGTVLALCAGPFVEPSRIARVSGSTEWLIRAAAARNKSTPPNILSKLSTDAHPVVRALAAAARSDTREALNTQPEDPNGFDAARATVEIRKAFKGKVGKSTRDTVASDPRSPVQLLKMLSKDKDSHARRSVALNPSSPVALLEALAKDTSSGCSAAASRARKLMGLPPLRAWDVPIAVARNLNTPVALLEALAKETDSGVRGSVAKNRNTSVALLAVLAKDKDSSVRRSVAENPNTPVAMLEALASDMDSWVRESVAKNPSTPVAALEALVEDDKRWVRHGVAGNPTTPVVVLERLAKHSDARDFVASNPSTPRELCIPLLEALAKDTAWQVRRSVAANPRTPVSVLRDLAKSKVELVRSAVAGNPSTPASLLDVLSKDKEESVRQSAARAHQPRGASVEQPAQDLAGEAARFHEEALAMLSPRDKSVLPEASILEWLERLFALPAASDNKTLTKASRNKNWLLRLGVALHAQASDAMLEFLSADTDADVAAAARAKLSQRSRC